MTALLLSLGLLAVFALLRRGLASRMELEAETRGAAFADAAFNTLRFVSEQIARGSTATNDTWGAFWISFGAGSTNLPLTVDSMEEPLDPSVTRTALLYGTTEAHIAYQCSAIGTNAFEGFLEHYPTNRAQVTLHVWPSGLTNAPAQTFFTLFSNPGRLP
jgi:Tfp pilus assembly protein PilV